MSSVIINGKITNHIDVLDRGLQYGDGLFETIALKNNILLLWQQHLNRLSQSSMALGLPCIDEQLWLDDIRTLNIENKKAVIKLILTRGIDGRGYRASNNPEVSRIVSVHPWPEYSDENSKRGINAIFCKTRVSINSTLAGMKHLNRLENVLARNEWHDETVHEGLMLDNNDHVIEGTMSNIFAVNNDILYTPKLNFSGVQGVVRDQVIQIAKINDIEVQETCLNKDLILNMDELFITNSLIGIWPIINLQGQDYNIGQNTSLIMEKLEMTSGSIKI